MKNCPWGEYQAGWRGSLTFRCTLQLDQYWHSYRQANEMWLTRNFESWVLANEGAGLLVDVAVGHSGRLQEVHCTFRTPLILTLMSLEGFWLLCQNGNSSIKMWLVMIWKRFTCRKPSFKKNQECGINGSSNFPMVLVGDFNCTITTGIICIF